MRFFRAMRQLAFAMDELIWPRCRALTQLETGPKPVSSLPQAPRMRVHGVHQRRHILWRGELADAVAQVENVRRAGGAAVGVRLAEAVEHAGHFSFNLRC